MKLNNETSLELLKGLSTQELDDLLQKELHKETADGAFVRMILGVLEEREQDHPLEVDAEIKAAADRFEQSLYDQQSNPSPKQTSWVLKAASILLVVGVLLFAIPQAANAETFWEMLSRWTDSVFEFFVPGDNDDKQPEYAFKTDNPGLQEIYNSVVELGITEPVVPMWVPQEYVLEELFVLEEPSESSVCAIMKDHENELIISIAVQSAHAPLNHMKDTQNVEVLERDGIEHYIISNNEQVIATWATKNIECSVVMDCQEDIYRILNSVYTTEVQ